MVHSDLYAQVDRYAYINSLAKSSPISKAFFAFSALILSVSSQSIIVPIIVFCSSVFILLKLAKIPVKFFTKLWFYPTLMAGLGCLFIALFFGSGETLAIIRFPWFEWAIFRDGVMTSITTFFRVQGAISCLFFLVLTTSTTDIFITLRKMKIPKVLVEMALLIYRYIFVFIELAVKMTTAQTLRLGNRGALKRIRSLALLVGNLFIRTLEQGERTLIAMNARGYDGEIRVMEDLPKPNRFTLLGILLFDFLLIYLIILTIKFGVV